MAHQGTRGSTKEINNEQMLNGILCAYNGALESHMIAMNKQEDDMISMHANQMANLQLEHKQE